MMKVLLLTQIYPPNRGGAAVFYSNLVRTNNSEFDFTITSEYIGHRDLIEEYNTEVCYRILPPSGWLPRFVQMPLEAIMLFLFGIYQIIIKDVDIIHTHASRTSIVGLSASALLFGTPIIYDCRDTGFRSRVVRLGRVPAYFSAARNIDKLLAEYGIPRNDIVRLPVVNPKYVRQYRNMDTGSGVNNLIFIGSIVEAKGVFLLPQIIKNIHHQGRDIHLTITGGGPACSKLKSQCQDIGIWDCVTFTGPISHRKSLDHLAKADVLVLPSKSEGIPRVILEAQEVGTPVVATSVGGIPDAITHRQTGMLADQNIESFVNHIIELKNDQRLYKKLAKQGIKESNKYDWESVGRQLKKIYHWTEYKY